MKKNIIATTSAPAAIGPYSQAIDCGSFIVTSGQVPIDPATGNLVEGDQCEGHCGGGGPDHGSCGQDHRVPAEYG